MIAKLNPALIFALLLAGCAGTATNTTTTTPPVPTPPQITAANAVNALAQSLDTAITGMRAARDAGKLQASDVANAEKVAVIIATAGKAIDAELRSADTWQVQEAAIIGIVTQLGVQGTAANLPPLVGSYLSAAVALINQVSAAVGGPKI